MREALSVWGLIKLMKAIFLLFRYSDSLCIVKSKFPTKRTHITPNILIRLKVAMTQKVAKSYVWACILLSLSRSSQSGTVQTLILFWSLSSTQLRLTFGASVASRRRRAARSSESVPSKLSSGSNSNNNNRLLQTTTMAVKVAKVRNVNVNQVNQMKVWWWH